MMTAISLLSAVLLFVVAIRMSAFFSGTETGFYRLSRIRLSIQSQAGNGTASRLLWFTGMPERFVAMALVGNNIANYLATIAIGLMATALVPDSVGTVEVLLTLAFAPLIFIWGELIPKTVYFRAPMRFLGKHVRSLTVWYYVLRPISRPLTLISKLVERFAGSGDKQPLELLLGRNRLIHVLNEGHREGLLSDVQRRLSESVMELAGEAVDSSMTPVARVISIPADATADEALEVSRKFSLSHILVHRSDDERDWFGFVCAGDLRAGGTVDGVVRSVVSLSSRTGKLDALQELRTRRAFFGVVMDDDKTLGVVTERGLMAQLFRPRQMAGFAR